MNGFPASTLDSVRITEGAQKCEVVFGAAYKRGAKAAAALLGETRTYPTLFILIPQIEQYRLHPYLSLLKRASYDITDQILNPADSGFLSVKNASEYSALKWMIGTGYNESVSGEYDEVLDIAASVLIGLYRDKSVLPLVADMIFARRRAGRNIHNLSWAFFRSRDPEALRLIARRMDSEEDSELACRLLGVEDTAAMAGGKRSGGYLKWLGENKDYLYFTDENFQLKSRPSVCRVDLERKYTQRRAGSRTRQPAAPGDGGEGGVLAAFRQLKSGEQTALSEYSQKLSGDRAKWYKWMALPITEQLEQARKAGVIWL